MDTHIWAPMTAAGMEEKAERPDLLEIFSPKGARSLSPAQRAGSPGGHRWRPEGPRDVGGSHRHPRGSLRRARGMGWDLHAASIRSQSIGPSALRIPLRRGTPGDARG